MTTDAPPPGSPRFRQIHLDFHTSEHLSGVGSRFDPDEFASTLRGAHVDSVTLFAKCHHGWSYYPTEVGAPHPNLARPDLLGEMIEACAGAGIETPVYLSVQWDERNARLHPEWRAMPAENTFPNDVAADRSTSRQLSPAWHTLCLGNDGYRAELVAQALEVAARYPIAGLFFDIVLTPACVCPGCVDRMVRRGLDPERAEDRRLNDEDVNAVFRSEMTAAVHTAQPALRVFYNDGHLAKGDRRRYVPYTHLELESLPTGGWGYEHFPLNARYSATLGMDAVAHTGKFHLSWGEFGGFKRPDALIYETAQMVALGARCLVGDQLHPSGAINADTYASIAPAYARIERLEPFVAGARAVVEVAVLCAEQFRVDGGRNHPADDGAVQMLQELKHPFDVVDADAELSGYRLLILPDDVEVGDELAARLTSYLERGGALIASWRSGLDGTGERFTVPLGVSLAGPPTELDPTYISVAAGELDPDLPANPFVAYGAAQRVAAGDGTRVLAHVRAPYFNRTYRHFTSHQHAPDDVDAEPLGPAVTCCGRAAYLAHPIFGLYHAYGQPLYKYVVRGLLAELLPDPLIATDLPSGARAWLTHQPEHDRFVVHLLFGGPQVRGRAVPDPDTGTRLLEAIEDVPTLAGCTVDLRLAGLPGRVVDALTGEPVAWTRTDDRRLVLHIDRLHIHRAIVIDGVTLA